MGQQVDAQHHGEEQLMAILPPDLGERLERIEDVLRQLVELRTTKDWYTTAEVAERRRKSEFTVREWCRLGRVHAKKRICGRGRSQEWMISHEELLRISNEGLLPVPKH